MKKIMLLSYLGFLFLPAESCAMPDDQDLPTNPTSRPLTAKEAFEDYMRTGSAGKYGIRYDHLGDLLSNKQRDDRDQQENIHPNVLKSTRGSTFYIPESSKRKD